MTGRACRSLGSFQGKATAAGARRLQDRDNVPDCATILGATTVPEMGTGLVLEHRGNVGRHTLTPGQGQLRTGLISAIKRHSRFLSGCPANSLQAVTHPRHGRARPCLASEHAPTTGVNGSQRARPPLQTDGQLDQPQREMLPASQSARPWGGAPLTSRPLSSSMGPAAAAAGGPGRRSPPVGAVLRLVLAVAAVLVVVLLR